MDNMSSLPMDGHITFSQRVGKGEMTFPTGCAAYGINGTYVTSLVDFMSEIFSGNFGLSDQLFFTGTQEAYDAARCNPWNLKGLINRGNAGFESIDLNMQFIATVITSEMRRQGGEYGNHTLQLPVKRTVLETMVCTKSYWMWLSFPLALTLLTILLLFIVYGKVIVDP